MKSNKYIERGNDSIGIFDNRSLTKDYPTLLPLLKPGMHVLDVGCGTGAISKGIAEMIGSEGKVTGIDHTASFISHGQRLYQETTNLELIASDWETFFPDEQFELIVSARVLQWLSTPQKALEKMKSWLKPDGKISILDYNHEALEWIPAPPKSMLRFYETF